MVCAAVSLYGHHEFLGIFLFLKSAVDIVIYLYNIIVS